MVNAPSIEFIRTLPSHPTRRKLFVNLPVADIQRSVTFFETLGFAFNPHFTDAQTACMVIGADTYAMLLTRERFGGLTTRPIADPHEAASSIFAFSVESRQAVGAMVETALLAGGSPTGISQDLAFRANASFFDPDGYVWEVCWMSPAAG